MENEVEATEISSHGKGAGGNSSDFEELPIFGELNKGLQVEEGKQKEVEKDIEKEKEVEKEKSPAERAAEKEKNQGKTPEQIAEEKEVARIEAERIAKEGEEVKDTRPAIERIIEKTGYNIEGEFESSVDGITEYIQKVTESVKREAVEGYVAKVPIVKDFAEYLANGGHPSRFIQTMFPETEFSEIKFEGDEDPKRETIIKEHLLSTGYNVDEVKGLMDDYRTSNLIIKMSDMALSKLQSAQAESKTKLLENQQKEAERQAKSVSDYWDNMKVIITKTNEVVGIPIVDKDKEAFFNYMALATDDHGRSQAMIDMNPEDPTERMKIQYLVFKVKQDPQFFQKVIKTKVISSKAGELDDLLSEKEKDRLGGKTKTPDGKPASLKGIQLFDEIE